MDKSFFDRVYDIVIQIPHGRVTSYGAIAAYLGSKGSSRMVGWAMNSSKNLLKNIPAHRVVNRIGVLTGKHSFGGNDIMADLLRSEGVEVEKNTIVNFKNYFWDPSTDLM